MRTTDCDLPSVSKDLSIGLGINVVIPKLAINVSTDTRLPGLHPPEKRAEG